MYHAAGRLRIPPEEMLAHVRTEPALAIVAAFWPQGKPMQLKAIQIQVLLESILFDAQARAGWNAQIDLRAWGKEPGWRWIADRAGKCDTLEEEAIRGFSGRAILRLLMPGPVPSSAADQVSREDVQECVGKPPQGHLDDPAAINRVERVLGFVSRTSRSEIFELLGVWLLAAARVKGYRREQVVATLSREGLLQRLMPVGRKDERLIRLLRSALQPLGRKAIERLARQHWPC